MKREVFDTGLSASSVWLDVGITRFVKAQAAHNLGSGCVYLGFVCVYLLIGSVTVLLVHRLWAEAAFVATSSIMSLISGTLWGMPRFTIFLFPVFLLIGRLHQRQRILWYLYLLLSALAQAAVLVNYVNAHFPAP